MKLIGLSLSFCIQDILDGYIKEEDVEKIISNTALSDITTTLDDELYSTRYWGEYDQATVEALLLRLKDKIEQPRLKTNEADYIFHTISQGHWIKKIDGWTACIWKKEAIGEYVDVRAKD